MKRTAKQKRWALLNPDRVNAAQARYRKKNPERVAAAQKRYRKKHSARYLAARRNWRKRNIDRERKRELEYSRRAAPYLRRKFGITLIQYETMLANQAGACAICGADTPRKAGQARFCVDHDHDSNTVRGLLCVPCNTALGLFEDKTERLVAAIQYLRR